MAWDDTKSEFNARSSTPSDEKITASEWNSMVSDQKGRVETPLTDIDFATSGDTLQWQENGDDDLILKNTTDVTTLLIVDQDTGDVTYDALTGTPSMGTHDHSEGGTATVPNAGLSNDSVTVAGNSVPLGNSTAVDYVDLNDTGSSFPVPNSDLSNDSVTVTAGDGLKNGGAVTLGASTTVDVEPADFAGAGLADDGGDNLVPDTSDEGTITASGGSSPAADTTVSTSLSQTDAYDVIVYADADPSFDADYQFNYDHAHFWDDSAGTLKIDLTVNWDTDPGSSNDVTLRWEVIRR